MQSVINKGAIFFFFFFSFLYRVYISVLKLKLILQMIFTATKETFPPVLSIADLIWFINEPRHDKTNKVTVRPAKTQE